MGELAELAMICPVDILESNGAEPCRRDPQRDLNSSNWNRATHAEKHGTTHKLVARSAGSMLAQCSPK